MKHLIRLTTIWLATFFILGTVNDRAMGYEFRVLIDAGHGGVDRGAQVSRRVFEKDVTLAIAKKIAEILSHEPSVDTVLTRLDDREVTLEARRSVMKSANADLFISLHINAGFGMTASGYEIYFSEFPDTEQKEPEAGDVIDDMLETTYINNSIRFSNIVDRELGRVFPREGRGLRGAPMAILEDAPLAAVLIELGFASNVDNRRALRDNNTQERLAGVIADSIKIYFAGAR